MLIPFRNTYFCVDFVKKCIFSVFFRKNIKKNCDFRAASSAQKLKMSLKRQKTMRKPGFQFNWMENYVFASLLYVLHSFCIFAPKKCLKIIIFFDIFAKKWEKKKHFFLQNQSKSWWFEKVWGKRLSTWFFCYFFVFISYLRFLISFWILQFFQIFLKN